MAKVKAYSYIRFSRAEQLRGDSLQRQLARAREWAEKEGYELDEKFYDFGVSAYRGKHRITGALSKFLELVNRGEVAKGSYLVIESLDRLSREAVIEVLPSFTALLAAGIKVVTLEDGMKYDRDALKKDWSPLVISLSAMARAHSESSMKEQRQVSVWINKRAAARAAKTVATAAVPGWLKVVVEGGQRKIVVDEERAPAVRKIFELAVAGYGRRRIVRYLNAHRDTYPTMGTGGRSAKAWQDSYVVKILKNRAVLGEYQPKRLWDKDAEKKHVPEGPPIKDYYPAVVDVATFVRAQRAIADRTGRAGKPVPGLPNLFRGLTHCAMCGSRMQSVYKGEKGGRWHQCATAARGAGCSNKRLWPFEMVEELVCKTLDQKTISKAIAPDMTDAEKRIEELNDKNHNLSLQASNITKAIRIAQDDDSIEQLTSELRQINQQSADNNSEISKLKYEIDKSASVAESAELLPELLELIHHDDLEIKERSRLRLANVLREFVQKIRFFPDAIEVIAPTNVRLMHHDLPVSRRVYYDGPGDTSLAEFDPVEADPWGQGRTRFRSARKRSVTDTGNGGSGDGTR